MGLGLRAFVVLWALATVAIGATYTQLWNFTPSLAGGKATNPVICFGPDGSAFTAYTLSPVSGTVRAIVNKLDLQGNVVWTKVLDDPVAAKFQPRDIVCDGANVVVTGKAEGPPSAKEEMFTVNLRESNGNVVWFHEENTNFLPDAGQELEIAGDSVFVVGTAGHDIVGVRIRLADGLEIWQRTFDGMDSTVEFPVGLVLTPERDVFIASTREIGSDPRHIVLIKVSADGQLLNEVTLDDVSEAADVCLLDKTKTNEGVAVAVVGTTIVEGANRPYYAAFSQAGDFGQNSVYLDNLGERFGRVAIAADGGFCASYEGPAGVGLSNFDKFLNPIETSNPVAGSVGGLTTDSFLNPLFFQTIARTFSTVAVTRFIEFDGVEIAVFNQVATAKALREHRPTGVLGLAIQTSAGTARAVTFRALDPKPVAHTDVFQVFQGQSVHVAAPGVLANDVAGAGAIAAAVNFPVNASLASDGAFDFQPTPGSNGKTTLQYRVTRPGGQSNGFIDVLVQPIVSRIEVPAEATGGTQFDGQVVLTGPSLGGLTTTVSENSTLTLVQAPNLTFPVGQTSAAFHVFTAATRTDTVVTFSTNLGGLLTTQNMTIRAPRVASLTTLTRTTIGSAKARFRVTLNGVAPANGISVSLSDDSSFLQVPAAITVLAGQTTRDFDAFTAETTTTKTATATATLLGSTATSTVQIVGRTFSLNPVSVTGGSGSTGKIVITSQNQGSPITFNLSENSQATTVPATASIATNTSQTTFVVSTIGVGSSLNVTVTISGQGIARAATLTVNPAILNVITLNPISVRGGGSFVETISLTGQAPQAGAQVTLSTPAPNLVQIPANVLIPGGATNASVTGTTSTVTSNVMVTLSASRNGVTRTATIVITP